MPKAINIINTVHRKNRARHCVRTHTDLPGKHSSLNIENIGLAKVKCDNALPIPDISSNGARIPEKNICGTNTIGSQLIAMFTFFDRTLMHKPRIAPEKQAEDSTRPTANVRGKSLNKKRTHAPKRSAWKIERAPKTMIFEAT